MFGRLLASLPVLFRVSAKALPAVVVYLFRLSWRLGLRRNLPKVEREGGKEGGPSEPTDGGEVPFRAILAADAAGNLKELRNPPRACSPGRRHSNSEPSPPIH
ncbi:hypothetical protein MTO96_006387 [Rhipicephalus appendiculatus]